MPMSPLSKARTRRNVKAKRPATLRTCASCEWIFKVENSDPTCPKCRFGSYGARYVYGSKAYTYAKTQKPWKDNKMLRYGMELDREIRTQQQPKHGDQSYEW